jgi:hypothetical protein
MNMFNQVIDWYKDPEVSIKTKIAASWVTAVIFAFFYVVVRMIFWAGGWWGISGLVAVLITGWAFKELDRP